MNENRFDLRGLLWLVLAHVLAILLAYSIWFLVLAPMFGVGH
jgi:hypothetical protein